MTKPQILKEEPSILISSVIVVFNLSMTMYFTPHIRDLSKAFAQTGHVRIQGIYVSSPRHQGIVKVIGAFPYACLQVLKTL